MLTILAHNHEINIKKLFSSVVTLQVAFETNFISRKPSCETLTFIKLKPMSSLQYKTIYILPIDNSLMQ